MAGTRWILMMLFALLLAAPAHAQTFPQLTGRVVDQANLLSPEQEGQLTQRLEALERASTRQLVVVTLTDLQGYDIADYGYRLGRHWGIGQRESRNGAMLIVAPSERRMRIEVGYGLEPILTDALSNQIINDIIRPRFRENDFAGGIIAGTDAIIQQLGAPPEQAEQRALQAAEAQRSRGNSGGGSIFTLIFWGIVILFIIMAMARGGGRRGRRYGTHRRRRGGPIVIWGSGGGWGGGGGGWGSGGGGWGGGGGGGFSGGGGSFGGGGASGGW